MRRCSDRLDNAKAIAEQSDDDLKGWHAQHNLASWFLRASGGKGRCVSRSACGGQEATALHRTERENTWSSELARRRAHVSAPRPPPLPTTPHPTLVTAHNVKERLIVKPIRMTSETRGRHSPRTVSPTVYTAGSCTPRAHTATLCDVTTHARRVKSRARHPSTEAQSPHGPRKRREIHAFARASCVTSLYKSQRAPPPTDAASSRHRRKEDTKKSAHGKKESPP